MLNDYWIVTLLIGEVISLTILFSAMVVGIQIAIKWDIGSSSAMQLGLERRSYLISTMMMYVFIFEMLSLWLFVIIINDHLPPLIKGAMCGTGALNANRYGWVALLLKIGEFILLSLWLVVHHLDRRVPEYPLTREKFFLLLLLVPLVLVTSVVQMLYFLNINPNIITTCCSITFNSIDAGAHQDDLRFTIDGTSISRLFYAMVGIELGIDAIIVASKKWLRRIGPMLVPISGMLFFVVALQTIIHHYAKYIYGMPSHHCPFDMLWREYYFVGYVIYGLLFISVISSISVGVIGLARYKQQIQAEAISICRIAATWNAMSTSILFVLLVLA